MGQREQKIASYAQTRQRDAAGHFIPVPQASPAIDTHATLDILASPVTSPDPSDNIVEFKVRNPLHKIFTILDDIKKHQSTTFAIKFTIPLIALPIFLLVAFQLGRAQIACVTSFSSQVGTVHVSTIQAPKEAPSALSTMLSFFPSIPALTPSTKLISENRAILISSTGQIYHIIYNQNIPISLFEGRRVAVTGNVSACTNSIALDSAENISVLP